MSRVIRDYGYVQAFKTEVVQTVESMNKNKNSFLSSLLLRDVLYDIEVTAKEEESGIIITVTSDHDLVDSCVVDEEQFCDAFFDCLLHGQSVKDAIENGDFPAADYFRALKDKLIERLESQTIIIPSDDDLMIV